MSTCEIVKSIISFYLFLPSFKELFRNISFPSVCQDYVLEEKVDLRQELRRQNSFCMQMVSSHLVQSQISPIFTVFSVYKIN